MLHEILFPNTALISNERLLVETTPLVMNRHYNDFFDVMACSLKIL